MTQKKFEKQCLHDFVSSDVVSCRIKSKVDQFDILYNTIESSVLRRQADWVETREAESLDSCFDTSLRCQNEPEQDT